MPGGSNGYQAALVRRQLTPGLISSLLGTVRLPRFIFFSTSYPELDSAWRWDHSPETLPLPPSSLHCRSHWNNSTSLPHNSASKSRQSTQRKIFAKIQETGA